jgi:hypothetical protein
MMQKRESNIGATEAGGEPTRRGLAPDRFIGSSFNGDPNCAQCKTPMRIERRQGLRRVYRCSACGLLDKTPM